MWDPVGVESLGTDPTKLRKSLPHLCATYLAAGTGESTVCAMGSAAPAGLELEQFLKGFAPRGDSQAGGMSPGRGGSGSPSCTRCIGRGGNRSDGGLWRGAEGKAWSVPSSLIPGFPPWLTLTLPCADSPSGALLRCSAPPARCCAEQREEVQHHQNPPAVPRRHLP